MILMWGRLKCSDLICALMIPHHKAGPWQWNKSGFTEVIQVCCRFKATDKQGPATPVSSRLSLTAYWTTVEGEWWEGRAGAQDMLRPKSGGKILTSSPAYCLLPSPLSPSMCLWIYYPVILVCHCLPAGLWFTVSTHCTGKACKSSVLPKAVMQRDNT